VLVLFVLPLFTALATDGKIEGKVTDPKGAAVVGASITIHDPANNLTLTAVTDDQGRFKADRLAAGSYTISVSAKGFAEWRRENVNVGEGQAAPLEIKLEIAPVVENTTVNVNAGSKGNADPLYQQLRMQMRSPGNAGDEYAKCH